MNKDEVDLSRLGWFVDKQQRNDWTSPSKLFQRNFEVCVVGGGLSGVAAAVAAARRGMGVVLLEETHMLGGQATIGGVPSADVPFEYASSINDFGIWGEIVKRATQESKFRYGLPVNTCRYKDQSFAPSVVIYDRVLTDMIRESNVQCLRRTTVEHVERTQKGFALDTSLGSINSKILIDATEEGEILEKIKSTFRIGNIIVGSESGAAGDLRKVQVQDITQTALIRRYPNNDIPDWAIFKGPPPEYDRYREKVSAYYPNSPRAERVGPNSFAGYRATPDLGTMIPYTGSQWQSITRTSLNYGNDLSIKADYFFSKEAKKKYQKDATLKTLAICFYLQQELGLPWGIAGDEGFGIFPNFREVDSSLQAIEGMVRELPLVPYVREARRGVGLTTLTGKQIYRVKNRTASPWNRDAVAVGYYATDIHGGRQVTSFEDDLKEQSTDRATSWRTGPFPIPFGSLVSAEIDGLLFAEKNISSSRIANSATRVHPTVVGIGEAAGVIAAVSASTDIPTRDLRIDEIQSNLAAGGALLAPFRIRGMEVNDPHFSAASLSVCHELVESESEFVSNGHFREPMLKINLSEAALAGKRVLDNTRSAILEVSSGGINSRERAPLTWRELY